MLKRYAVRYAVDAGNEVSPPEIKTAQCFLDETQSSADFPLMIAITKLHNAREVYRIQIMSYQRLKFDGSC